MARKKIYLSISICILISSLLYAQEIKETGKDPFSTATELYSAGNYREAYDIWVSLYNSGRISASLCFNIGNACFKMNDIPGSILYFERALLLKPSDEDIDYNLQIARTMVVDKFAGIPEIFFVTWFNFISLSLPSNLWAQISLAAFILSLLFISLYFYTARYSMKVLGFWLAVFLMATSIFTLTSSLRNRSLVYHNDHAIIFSPAVNGKSSPDQSGKDLFVLHEGTKVTIEDEVGGWYEIRLSDGNKGWVPSNSLTRI